MTKLKDVCTIIAGQSPESKYYNTDGNGLPFFQGKADFGDLYPTIRVYCTQPTKIVEKDDILLSVRAPVGATNLAPCKVCIGRGLTAIRPKEELELKYLLYYFRYIEKPLQQKGTGTTFKAITQNVVKNLEINVPAKDEQRRIVAKIEELFSQLDSGVETLKKTKAQLAVYRQAVLKEAFEGGFSNANSYEIKKIKDFAKVDTGATPLTSNREYYGGKIAWVTSSKINDNYIFTPSDYITEKALLETNCKLFSPHTLLVAMYGEGKTRGKCAELMISAATNQALAAIQIKQPTHVFIPYVKWYLTFNYQNIRRKAAGGVQPNLNLSIIKNISIPMYDYEKQKKIVEEIESRLSVCDSIEKTVDEALQQAEGLRQSILKKAFEGGF